MEPSYIREIYIDKYQSLQQIIVIDCYMNKQSNGNHARTLRSSVNPNLFLWKTEYLNKNMEVIKNGK